jgi:hypothetical protein
MKTSNILLVLFIVHAFCLFVPQTILGQTEKLDIVQFTPPKGWTKTPKDGAMVLGDIDKATGKFCLLTIYNSSTSAGTPQKDFANEWNNRVAKPFNVPSDIKTETQTSGDGWQATVGGTTIEFNGIKAAAVLTVFSGFGKSASVFAIFNDESYLAQADALITGIKLDKNIPPSSSPSSPTTNLSEPERPNSEYLDFDPFPDKPHIQAQQPLIGRLRKTITMADLAGTWEVGGASVMEYITSSSQSTTSVSFGRTKYTIRADGSYDGKFQGRASNTTIRESESGTISLSGGFIIKRDRNNRELKYQFVAFMIQPNGAAVLTMIYLGENPPMDAEALRANCGHAHGYITCMNGEEWVRIPPQGK